MAGFTLGVPITKARVILFGIKALRLERPLVIQIGGQMLVVHCLVGTASRVAPIHPPMVKKMQ